MSLPKGGGLFMLKRREISLISGKIEVGELND